MLSLDGWNGQEAIGDDLEGGQSAVTAIVVVGQARAKEQLITVDLERPVENRLPGDKNIHNTCYRHL